MPNVSLIIPVFNAERFLQDCFDSIKDQSFSDVQIIFVDDCSTDNSFDLLEKFEEIDARVDLYRLKKNSGPARARNFGLKKAKGDYVQFVDADDLLPLNAVEKLYKAAAMGDGDLVRGNGVLFQDGDFSNFTPMPNIHWVKDALDLNYRKHNFHGLPWFHPVFLFKKNFLLDNDLIYPDLRVGEDPIFILEILMCAEGAATVSDIVYQCRTYKKEVDRFKFISEFEDYVYHYLEVKKIWLNNAMYMSWQDYFDQSFWSFWRYYASKNRLALSQIFDSLKYLFLDFSPEYISDLKGFKKDVVINIIELSFEDFELTLAK